jgi:cytochrome c-type biogenesis protein CcmH
MNWIWILPALLLLSLSMVFYPLFSKRGGRPLPVGLEGDPLAPLLFERDMLLRQLKEISLEDDHEGDDDQKGRLERELSALLLRLDKMQKQGVGKKKKSADSQKNSANAAWAISTMLLVALCSSGLYFVMGTAKEVPPSQAPAAGQVDVKAMVQRLAERMKQEPKNREGWMQLARSYGVLGQFDDAMQAYTHLLSLDPEDMDVSVAMAEVQVRSGNSEQLKAGLERFQDVLNRDPNRVEALWFLGSMALQVGERDIAIQKWQRLLGQLKPGTANYDSVKKAISEAKNR